MQKAFWGWKVFVTKFKWNTLTWSICSSVVWGLLFTVWNKEIIQPLNFCAWERERHAECFPIKWDLVIVPDPLGVCHLQWVKLHRSWRCHFGEHSNPRNVLYILKRGAYDFRLLERHDKEVFLSLFILFFSSFCRYSFFLLKDRLDKRIFENVSRNHANTHLTRHLQITSWSKIQDTLLHTKSRII